jgi:cobalt-zinc-cadmium efflux system protein
MSTTETALTVHIVCPGDGFNDAKLGAICAALRDRFGIAHTTIQVERGDGVCWQAPADVV